MLRQSITELSVDERASRPTSHAGERRCGTTSSNESIRDPLIFERRRTRTAWSRRQPRVSRSSRRSYATYDLDSRRRDANGLNFVRNFGACRECTSRGARERLGSRICRFLRENPFLNRETERERERKVHRGGVACRAAKRPSRPAMKRDFVAPTDRALDETPTKDTYRFPIEFLSASFAARGLARGQREKIPIYPRTEDPPRSPEQRGKIKSDARTINMPSR